MLSCKNYRILLLFTILMAGLSSCSILRNKPSVNTTINNNHRSTNNYSKKIIQTARSYTGVPYKSGGNDTYGLDCSGLLCITFKELGIKLPRISWQQSEFFPAIDLPHIQKGDLVFFVTSGKNISHAGIVTEVKNEEEIIFIHASTSKGVIEDNMMTNYWKSRFAKVCRPKFKD
ncbi:C40 family peptidase [Emticicia sp. SJ17W-69]|uniref:C40 family peptidase n=1 Tax=Emticicia sp. SJ17W-69 TaxID=3421657 RepID=UPI003EBD4A28